MIRHLLIGILFSLSLSQQAYAGYSIYTAPQIPEYVSVNGPYGPELIVNPAQPVTPTGFGKEVCRPDNFSPYSTDAARRTRVFYDNSGTALSADLFAACPQIRQVKEREIRAEGSKRLLALATPYAPEERETWITQQREAESYLLDSAAPTPMIDAMATGRGISKTLLVSKIMENVNLFRAAAGAILGQQQRLLDETYATTDFAALLAISWPN